MGKAIELPFGWRPRNYQLKAWRHFEGNKEGLRGVCVWHRRAGKDLFAINQIAVKSQERVGTYWHMLPTYKQGRAIVWNGFTREGKPFLSHFPRDMIAASYGAEMQMHFNNGSIYKVVGTDNIDSLVGTNPVGVVFSEYSLHDPGAWDYIRPILRENGGWALFIYTPRGKNHGWKLYQMAKDNPDWFCERLSVSDTVNEKGLPVISREAIEMDRKEGMSDQLISQEYFVDFNAPLEGAYYATQMERAQAEDRITNVPWDSRLPVDTAWDIGGDATSIVFTQSVNQEHRIIDYYENSGEPLPHYAKILHEKPYTYRNHFAPWDIVIKEYSTGKTRIEVAKSLGIKFKTTFKHDVLDGIEQVRSLLQLCWFDAKRCDRLVEALKSYRKEKQPERLGYSGEDSNERSFFKEEPLHDWASHPCDAFRYWAWNQKSKNHNRHGEEPPQTHAVDKYAYS